MRLSYPFFVLAMITIIIVGNTARAQEEAPSQKHQPEELSSLNDDPHNPNPPASTQEQANEHNLLPVSVESLRPRRRSADNEIAPPHLWALDLFEYSDFCYHDSQTVQLWRSDTKRAGELRIKNRSANQTVELRWPANKALIDWPLNRITLIEGAYLIQIEDILPQKVIHFHHLPPLTTAAQITWMQQQGCYQQAHMLN